MPRQKQPTEIRACGKDEMPVDYMLSLAREARKTKDPERASHLYQRAAQVAERTISLPNRGYWRERYRRLAAQRALDAASARLDKRQRRLEHA